MPHVQQPAADSLVDAIECGIVKLPHCIGSNLTPNQIIATKTGTFWSGYFWKTLVRETVHESIGGTSQPRHGMRAEG